MPSPVSMPPALIAAEPALPPTFVPSIPQPGFTTPALLPAASLSHVRSAAVTAPAPLQPRPPAPLIPPVAPTVRPLVPPAHDPRLPVLPAPDEPMMLPDNTVARSPREGLSPTPADTDAATALPTLPSDARMPLLPSPARPRSPHASDIAPLALARIAPMPRPSPWPDIARRPRPFSVTPHLPPDDVPLPAPIAQLPAPIASASPPPVVLRLAALPVTSQSPTPLPQASLSLLPPDIAFLLPAPDEKRPPPDDRVLCLLRREVIPAPAVTRAVTASLTNRPSLEAPPPLLLSLALGPSLAPAFALPSPSVQPAPVPAPILPA
ncbi:hypothetical protein AX14_009328 [Amanita brunnescens Koide BX004]|nr:hypothetical protein AX14_009328 [Amanita brunnescens Koide BX004]